MTGKTRSYMRDFGVSRQAFRKYAREWMVMWVRKASW
jgi:ribosomal protein S14